MKVEAKLVAYLSDALDCEVVTEVPNPRPDTFVSIERTGGGSDGLAIDRPTVAVQCWGKTRTTAMRLSQDAEKAMDALGRTEWCYRASKNSDYFFPGEGKEPRYQLVYDLACDPRA